MLKMIKEEIASIPDMKFSEYYNLYIMSVQDSNIDREIRFLMNRNILNSDLMQALIANTYEGLKEIYDYSSSITECI